MMMYQMPATSGGVLAVTGAAAAAACGWIAAWTLLAAGLAAYSIARVLRMRAESHKTTDC
jgi:hypothetical protein